MEKWWIPFSLFVFTMMESKCFNLFVGDPNTNWVVGHMIVYWVFQNVRFSLKFLFYEWSLTKHPRALRCSYDDRCKFPLERPFSLHKIIHKKKKSFSFWDTSLDSPRIQNDQTHTKHHPIVKAPKSREHIGFTGLHFCNWIEIYICVCVCVCVCACVCVCVVVLFSRRFY